MTRTPFNLTAALAGEAVVTRDGRPVTQLHRFYGVEGDKLFGVVGNVLFGWNTDAGNYVLHEHELDLFMAPREPKEIWRGWCNCYKVGIDSFHRSVVGGTYDTKCAALEWANSDGRDYLGTFEMIQLDNGELRRVG